jgi:uncharacterized protein (DUF2267 family)
MATTGLEVFDRTLHTTNLWLDEINAEIGPDRHLAWHVLGAVLRTLRDEMQVDQSAHFAAQLPLLIRGAYFDQYRPTQQPVAIRSHEDFISRIQHDLDGARPVKAEQAVAAVMRTLNRHVTEGQVKKVRDSLPKAVRAMWPEPDQKEPHGAKSDQEKYDQEKSHQQKPGQSTKSAQSGKAAESARSAGQPAPGGQQASPQRSEPQQAAPQRAAPPSPSPQRAAPPSPPSQHAAPPLHAAPPSQRGASQPHAPERTAPQPPQHAAPQTLQQSAPNRPMPEWEQIEEVVKIIDEEEETPGKSVHVPLGAARPPGVHAAPPATERTTGGKTKTRSKRKDG